MKTNHHAKFKLILAGSILTLTVLAQAEKAHAHPGILAVVYVTYLTGKVIVCTPVAAVTASEHTEGFGGAFEDCWNLRTSTGPTSRETEEAADEVVPDSALPFKEEIGRD